MSDIEQRPSGLFVPTSGPADPNAGARELEARFLAEAQTEAEALAEWARSWERAGQPPLGVLDIRQACVVRSQVYLWPVAFMKAVAARTIAMLGLDAAPAPPRAETRQQRRARERRLGRAPLTALPVIDPNGTSA